MPDFFTFQQGSDTRSRPPPDTSLRYGRFRAFAPNRKRSIGDILSSFQAGSAWAALDGGQSGFVSQYGTLNAPESDFGDEEEDERWWLDRYVISPRKKVVCHTVGRWYRRWAMLILLPAAISIIWCAFPFPTSRDYRAPRTPVNGTTVWEAQEIHSLSVWDDVRHALSNVFDFSVLEDMILKWFKQARDSLPADGDDGPNGGGKFDSDCGDRCETLNFWFFLIFYYGFYNLMALLMTTKFFNLYSVNWWPDWAGFPVSFTVFNLIPFFVGVIFYLTLPPSILHNNITWILLTFSIMCCPVFMGSLKIVTAHHSRHAPLRGVSDTQLLFHPQTSLASTLPRRNPARRLQSRLCPSCLLLPRSVYRFLWFCLALLLSMVAFVLGEVYSEFYLATLPHNSLETVMFVWSWVITVHALDLVTGWLVGNKISSDGSAHPLQWVFKFYFALTYQTYVRALYARLRSPGQFAYLQLLSSTIVVIWSPITMTKLFHSALKLLRVNSQPYREWQSTVGRGFYIRGIAENVSMVAWLGWVVVLHYGWNKEIYPYFSFDDYEGPYTFSLTFWASLVTWAAELVAGWIVRRVFRWVFGYRVTKEAVEGFRRWPEMLPAFVAVSVHVLQNMLFSMVRVRFA